MANFYKKSPSTDDAVWAGGKKKADDVRAPGEEMAGEKNFGTRKEKSDVEVVGAKERKVDISWLVRGKKKSSQLGRSMIEMLGVLAIIGVLSIAGIAGYTKAMEKHNINKLKDQLSLIITNISTVVAGGQSTSELRQEVIDSLHILPDEMGTTANCRHALGGKCMVVPGGAVNSVSIRFWDLSPAACIEMATLDLKSLNIKTYINAKNVPFFGDSDCTTEDGGRTCSAKKTRTIAEAAQECVGPKNAIVYLFYLKM